MGAADPGLKHGGRIQIRDAQPMQKRDQRAGLLKPKIFIELNAVGRTGDSH